MFLIPAIDLKDGQCVRLRQGRMEEATVFGTDPVAVAKRWLEEGAERLHIVDLDGATQGKPVNTKVIGEIVKACPALPVQIGGGIRDEETVQVYLDTGVQYVIIGTKAARAPHFVADLCVEYPKHILLGLDAKDGKVATDGWAKVTNLDVAEFACHFNGVEAIIYTDIGRDGMMQGFNVEATRRLAQAVNIPVIASGGVSTLADVDQVRELETDGVIGAIIGRALYEGTLSLKEATKRLRA